VPRRNRIRGPYGADPLQALDGTLGFLADLSNGHIEDGFEMSWQ
jgi:hypothetical protein